MPAYWEQNASGIHEANFNIEEDDDGCQIKKPHMKNDENK
jgi:hypothetical protein